jgi:peptide/nickel transport system permease protein
VSFSSGGPISAATEVGRAVGRFALSKPLGALGAVLVAVATAAALFAPVLAPYEPLALHPGEQFQPPGSAFLMGTDQYGRDALSRVLYGARTSLYIGLVSVALGGTIGGLVGLATGYLAGSAFDTTVQRIVEALMAFPSLILGLIFAAALGASENTVVLAIALSLAPQAQRLMRASALAARGVQFVEAARALGVSGARIVRIHILPQCIPSYLILLTSMLGQAMIVESAISFVGAGSPPPTPTWGNMMSEGARLYARHAPWIVVFPGLALSLTVFGFNLVGDALRDVLDPRLRGR